ncbi:MAG: GAF domain-containing sensor histidine kinase [Chloroflexi bacterium]|nr:GAF domain-containing sensor histidine kinase [Chloroflexota bacterium]
MSSAADSWRSEAAVSFLIEASALLARSLDYKVALQDLVHLAVPYLADWCTIDLVDKNKTSYWTAVAHVVWKKEAIVRELHRRYPLDAHSPQVVARVLRTGQPLVLPDISDAVLAATTQDDEHLQLVRQLAPRSMMAVPLEACGRLIGVMSFLWAESGYTYDWARMALAKELASRVATVVDTAQGNGERRRVEEALEQAQQAEIAAWSELDRRKTELITTIAHELRTPLTVVMGYTELLVTRLGQISAEEVLFMASEISSGAKILHQLVDDVFAFTQLETGELTAQPRPVDLIPVLWQAADASRLVTGGERLVTELPESLPAHADPERVGQVIRHLLRNALQYAPTGPITLRARQSDGKSLIEVIDCGPGIPVEEQSLIWERLYRGSGVATLHGARGMGLGLAVVKTLVESQNGRITLASVPGQGCTFGVVLPAVDLA